MECIKCRGLEANKESGLCDYCESEELIKINGLLYFPALGLIFGVVGGAIELYSFIMAAFNYFNGACFISYYLVGAFAFLICGFLVSLYATWLFFRCKKGTRKAMIANYVTGLIVALYLTVLPTIIFDVKQGSDNFSLLVSAIFGAVIWIPYLLFSKRINMVFCR